MTDHEKIILVVGSMNLDHILRVKKLAAAGETVLAQDSHWAPGGKSSNQAASAALLGARVELVGSVGADREGELLIHRAQALGIDVSGIVAGAKPTGTATVIVDETGENSIIVAPGANDDLTNEHVSEHTLSRSGVLVLSLECSIAAMASVAARAASIGTMVLVNASPMQELPRAMLESISVLVVNTGEAELLTGVVVDGEHWTLMQEELRRLSIDRAIITRGSEGAVVLDRDEITVLDSIKVTAVDTTGCGDAFMGAVAAELALGHSLVDAARVGTAAGAWAATMAGAQDSYATREQLGTLLD